MNSNYQGNEEDGEEDMEEDAYIEEDVTMTDEFTEEDVEVEEPVLDLDEEEDPEPEPESRKVIVNCFLFFICILLYIFNLSVYNFVITLFFSNLNHIFL